MTTQTPEISPPHTPKAAKRFKGVARLGRVLLGIGLLCALFFLVIRVSATQSFGHRFIEHHVNMRSFGPLESLQINGLEGDLFSDFTVQSITIADKEGIWFSAQNISLDFRALPLLRRHLYIQDLTLGETKILRRPNLNTVEKSKPLNLKITLDQAHAPNMNFAETMVGQAFTLDIQSAFKLSQSGDAFAQLNAERIDDPAPKGLTPQETLTTKEINENQKAIKRVNRDSVSLDISRKNDGVLTGEFNLIAGANGPFARLIKAPQDQKVDGIGKLSGSLQSGDAVLTLRFDENPSVTARAGWTPQELTINARLPAKNWTVLAPLKALNSTPEFTLNLERNAGRMPFQIHVNAGQAQGTVTGFLPNPSESKSRFPTRAHINLSIHDPASLMALPDGYGFKDLKLTGDISHQDRLRFTGQTSLNYLISPYANIASVASPLTLSYTEQGHIIFDLKPHLEGLVPLKDVPLNLAPQTDITLSGRYDTTARTLNLKQVQLINGAQSVTVAGRARLAPLSYKLTGDLELSLLQTQNTPGGLLKSDYKIESLNSGKLHTQDPENSESKVSFPALSANGHFTPYSSPDAVQNNQLQDLTQKLIGEQLGFDINMDPIAGGFNITSASLRANGFKAEASGTVKDMIDIALEADLLTRLSYADVTLEAGTEISGHLTGVRETPNVKIDTQSPALTFRDYEISNARLRTDLKNIATAPTGPVRINAASEYGDIDVSVNFASTKTTMKLQDISARLGPLTVKGNLDIPQNTGHKTQIATGILALDLPKDGARFAKATLNLDNRGGKQGLKFESKAQNIAFKDLEFDHFVASGDGTLHAFTGTVSTRGKSGSGILKTPFSLETPIELSQIAGENMPEDKINRITLSPDVNYGRVPMRSKAPLIVSLAPSGLNISGGFLIRDGTLSFTYKQEDDRQGQIERLALTLDDIPVNLLPLPTALSETRGQVNAILNIGFVNEQIEGDLSANIDKWRGFDRKASESVTFKLESQVRSNGFAFNMSGTSPLGFDVDGAILLPITHQGRLTSIRPSMNTPISGTLKAAGASAALLGLVTPKDADLKGRLEANLDVSGTLGAPNAQGQINGENLRFEAPELGSQIRNGRFSLAFTNDSLTLSDLSAQSPQKGTLTGSGAFKLGEYGRPLGTMSVALDKFDILDRRDLSAKISGDVTVATKKKTTNIGGNLTILTATLKQFTSSTAGVIELDVEEINAPKSVRKIEPKTPDLPINLDLKIKAPRRLFVRSKGLDVELSLNAQIKGTLYDPRVYGTANVLRGGFTIASKTLAFDTGIIKFDGDIGNGQIDFLATTQTQNMDAKISIRGTVDTPEITLSSTPNRPEDEILSAILFGRSATELSAIEAAQLAGAIAQFSGGGGGLDLLGGVRDALGIGQLSIGMNDSGSTVITGGRYLAKNVYLQVFSGVGAHDSGAVIDWDLRKNISLRSRLQSDNDQSLSIKWKHDF